MTPQQYIRVVRTMGQVSLDQQMVNAATLRLQHSTAAAIEACRAAGIDPAGAPFEFDDDAFTITPAKKVGGEPSPSGAKVAEE